MDTEQFPYSNSLFGVEEDTGHVVTKVNLNEEPNAKFSVSGLSILLLGSLSRALLLTPFTIHHFIFSLSLCMHISIYEVCRLNMVNANTSI